jgi:hypothetical protein
MDSDFRRKTTNGRLRESMKMFEIAQNLAFLGTVATLLTCLELTIYADYDTKSYNKDSGRESHFKRMSLRLSAG